MKSDKKPSRNQPAPTNRTPLMIASRQDSAKNRCGSPTASSPTAPALMAAVAESAPMTSLRVEANSANARTGQQACIQPRLRGHAGDLRVAQTLRNRHRGERGTRHEISAQPAAPVRQDPAAQPQAGNAPAQVIPIRRFSSSGVVRSHLLGGRAVSPA